MCHASVAALLFCTAHPSAVKPSLPTSLGRANVTRGNGDAQAATPPLVSLSPAWPPPTRREGSPSPRHLTPHRKTPHTTPPPQSHRNLQPAARPAARRGSRRGPAPGKFRPHPSSSLQCPGSRTAGLALPPALRADAVSFSCCGCDRRRHRRDLMARFEPCAPVARDALAFSSTALFSVP
jgi:hypothetical protein